MFKVKGVESVAAVDLSVGDCITSSSDHCTVGNYLLGRAAFFSDLAIREGLGSTIGEANDYLRRSEGGAGALTALGIKGFAGDTTVGGGAIGAAFIDWGSGPRVLAFELWRSHKEGDTQAFASIFSSPSFSPAVVREALKIAQMTDAELIAAEAEELEELKSKLTAAVDKLNVIHSGASNRTDAADRAKFISWIKADQIVIKSIGALKQDWDSKLQQLMSNSYKNETLKKWYKVAMPHVVLSNGRPKKT